MAAPLPESIRNPVAEVTACPTCGQLIAGLPPVGRCPECGGAYDRHELVLFGRRRWHMWHLYGGVVTAGPMFYLSLGSRSMFDLFASTVWGLALAGAAVALVGRLFSPRPDHARLRLSRAGCGLDVEPPPPPVLFRLGAILFSTVGLRRRWWPADPWLRAATIPWYQVRQITITPAKNGRSRIKVARAGYTRGKAVPIDLTVPATDEQLAALRDFAGAFATVVPR